MCTLVRLTFSILISLAIGATQIAPVSATESYLQARTAERGERLDDAVDLYKRSMLQETSTYAVSAERLMRLLVRLHRYDEAEQVCNDLYRTTHDPQIRVMLGDIYRLSGNHYAAQRQYEEILATDPDNTAVLVELGQCYEATASYEKARECYNRASSKSGTDADTARRHLLDMGKVSSSSSSIDPDSIPSFWMPSKMPLKVFVTHQSGGTEYGCSFVRQAIQDWNSAMHGIVQMTTCNDADSADVVVTCVPQITQYAALGLTRKQYYKRIIIEHADVEIAVNVDCTGKLLPSQSGATTKLYEARDRMLHEVTLHELGHALGLSHSAKKEDIMANGIFGLTSMDVMTNRSLTPSDIERLSSIYTMRDKAIAMAVESIKKDKAAGKDVNHEKIGQAISDISLPDGDSAASADFSSDTANAAGISAGDKATDSTTGKAFGSASGNEKSAGALVSSAMMSVMFNLRCGNYGACIKDLKMIMAGEPSNVQAHYLLAVTLVNMRRYDEAVVQYKEVLRLQPKGQLSSLANAGLSKIQH